MLNFFAESLTHSSRGHFGGFQGEFDKGCAGARFRISFKSELKTEFVVPETGKKKEGRVALRKRRNREALVRAGYQVITQKGIDAATMLEISELADVGAGTVYSYFKSKNELAVAVLEEIMNNLAKRIESVTDTFQDPAQVYAYGVRTVIETATQDVRWKQILDRSELISNAMYLRMGPYAIRDLRLATAAGRFSASDPDFVWRMTTYAIIGVSRSINRNDLDASCIDETVVRLLCMAGIGIEEARKLSDCRLPAIALEEPTINLTLNPGPDID